MSQSKSIQSIRILNGVGEVRAKAYAKMGIHTLQELVLHYPRSFEHRGDTRLLSDCNLGEKNAVILTVGTEPKSARLRGRLSLLKFRAFDESGSCEIIFYNQDYLKNTFVLGSTFRFYGKLERKGKQYAMTSPAYEAWSEDVSLPPLIPIYPLTEGISAKQITKDIQAALGLLRNDETADPLPEYIRHRHSLCTYAYALRNIHMPQSYMALAAAKKRLIFDEFFSFALGLSAHRQQKEEIPAPALCKGDPAELLRTLPYKLTEAQSRTIEEIRQDLARPVAMSRMVVGDVGCGKTICAAAAMYLAVCNGKQAALMVPTEILAMQHYADLSALFAPLGIRCALLTSSVPKAKKDAILRALASSDPSEQIPIVIGTQALLTDRVHFAAPGLVVTDEQHRFGVRQRATLAGKNEHSHLLVMSATPIPRSMALTLYGDLDMSRIDQMPVGRQRVDTFVVNESYRDRLNGFIRKQVAEGGQVYIVCPAVEDAEIEGGELSLADLDDAGNIRQRSPMRSAVGFAEELCATFPDLCIAYLHGKMKPAQKEEIMQRFAAGEVNILVSTTVIEVGVNVPNACLMIVENAERFGLSQLHQLRGRVGRGTRKSYCVLVSDAPDGTPAAERLSVMHRTYDGYAIAERDLALRGPGDFLRSADSTSIRQSGGVRFRLAELCDDTGLLSAAFAEARALLQSEGGLEAYPLLAQSVGLLFEQDHDILN